MKRKPTGPSRLLLGKSRSPGQDEKKSDARKQRRQNNPDASDTEPEDDRVKTETTACEIHDIISESSRSGLEMEKGVHTEADDEHLGPNSNSVKQHDGEKVQKRNRTKAAFQRIFLPALICVRRKKESDGTPVAVSLRRRQDVPTNNDELQIASSDSLSVTKMCKADQKKKKYRRVFGVRMRSIFKRGSATSKIDQGQEKGRTHLVTNSVIEVIEEKTDQGIETALEEPKCPTQTSGHEAEHDQNRADIHDEDPALDCQEGFTDVADLNTQVSADSGPLIVPDVPLEEPSSEPSSLFNSLLPCINESISDAEEDPGATERTPEMSVPSRPVITIEDVHSSDDEDQEPVENGIPSCATLSGLLSLNECYKSKTKKDRTSNTLERNHYNNQLSEILLGQTALNLVRSAISGALEQLAAELRSQTDVDRAKP